jgi:GNAT superfamily N-acetyltransferase
VEILTPESTEDFARYYDLRWRILRAPWHQPRGSERDDLESHSWHRMACHEGRIPIGVARLHLNTADQAQIRYMAVETAHRRRGVGTALVESLEAQALSLGAIEILLHAREDTLGFYEHAGYSVAFPSHRLFDAIQHYAMIKRLR